MNRYIKVTGLFSLICIISLSILGVRGNLINAKAIVKLCTNPIVKESGFQNPRFMLKYFYGRLIYLHHCGFITIQYTHYLIAR